TSAGCPPGTPRAGSVAPVARGPRPRSTSRLSCTSRSSWSLRCPPHPLRHLVPDAAGLGRVRARRGQELVPVEAHPAGRLHPPPVLSQQSLGPVQLSLYLLQ